MSTFTEQARTQRAKKLAAVQAARMRARLARSELRLGSVRAVARRTEPVSTRPVFGSAAIAWALLFVNVLAFTGDHPTIIPIPGIVGQLITQGALPLALAFALKANPGGVIRPNLVLGLLTVNAVVALSVAPHSEFMAGSIFRAVRLLTFLAVLWLLTPWWGRPGMPLLRIHLRMLWIIIGSVLIGAVLAPGKAFSFENRLAGAIWPIPPTQVGHYAAILFGSVVVLWFSGRVTGRAAMAAVLVAGLALALTHTRTAISGLLLGLVVAGASLASGHARVRRVAMGAAIAIGVVVTVFASTLLSWALRGQNAQEAAQLTGRTKVWALVVAEPRTPLELLVGSGLGNKSFDGLPIDSNWMASYVEIGWFGIVMQIAVLIVILQMILLRRSGPERAVALMIMTYVLVASVTETGLCDASPYVLDVVVAAAILFTNDQRDVTSDATGQVSS